jgi:hypothetical protein
VDVPSREEIAMTEIAAKLQAFLEENGAEYERSTCVASHHAEPIRLAYRDFERLAKPQAIDLSVVYHGSPRECGAPDRG